MGSVEDEARNKALTMYKALAAVQFVLGIGLLLCGGFGTKYSDEDDFGVPYFIGGFVVGVMLLISALLCTCVAFKGADVSNDIKKKEVGCAIMGQYMLAMFSFMGCFIGLIFAGISGCDSFSDYCSSEKSTIRYVIIALIVVALLTIIFSMYIVCTYGSFFGVVMRRGGRGRMVMSIDTTNTAVVTTGTGLNTVGQGDRMQQLQRENELLQRQLQLQQQLNQQQQQYGGTYQPPPPPNYGFTTDPAYPPSAPPPPYGSLNK